MSSSLHNGWEVVIGLEVHVQLATRSKIFSGASTATGDEPNSHASLIDLGMPGTLPVVNKEAIRNAVRFGLAINADIGRRSVFERKNYFYPDLPKGYQTTQLAEPIVGAGEVVIRLEDGTEKTVRIHHAHLEEDAGKSLHEAFSDGMGHGQTGIDLNRAGTPLIEIVSEPDMGNAEEAVAYARKLHAIVTSLGICDGDMSQGNMRFDVNISVRRPGEPLGTRTETKNLNSFRFMEKAIKLEVERQIDVLEDGGKIVQETRLYNGDTNTARSMRTKEDANDYRYFPCPDLLPVLVSEEEIGTLRAELPELPDAREARYVEQYQLSGYDAGLLSGSIATARYFEAAAEHGGDAKLAANWVMGELAAKLNSEDKDIADSPVSAEQLGQLILRLKDGTISSKIAKQVFEACWNGEGDPDAIIEAKGLKQMSDTGELEKIVDQVIADSPAQVEDYRNADDAKRKKKIGYFVGQVMKATQGKANPQQVNQLLQQKLAP
ncbi:Asp-tRNA(Asn)/Glu-tRNA(Gln) amidotransferase subunit GatB [Alloalcanivorax profundimaris]|uniref:Asp-tRNA(Asn)/Glu-tRNA(Gln) amidotransferase subunit GatB n=1 Tax=Alloalcanivorax profundimaris TaxID=2735259 RepID=UPI000C65F039|nr:Asp-tRNA(Asn)/Glu-tRNA(Gln) amidotransferase subunit GatB [Alloalcanivorax profundimaris]MAO58559.1 Asp-tRNA(Asn)/Glu-tRNA(Gln) amidotransferase GatCAB subunit B [Alcanivorax sp.]MCQ6262511.1 Asp-tRNA(Asn)/Glu-tRNA(Gln) amidotransferase subunit GatB [Alcanivorax sp. MM125-6]UWN49049.1 Aspartyl/glutamyl-tRNA(Asn/Gln) amidotransferase subunit B [Alcanivorax sp. ALC70]MAY09724.1 Asp-tRNA(Asn)/Glu-tRNA(Gln) amidotransferase GatCAB subunit B [Alcanivorax sp.]MBF1800673.1 Asp-tRNA(Asn)/Glu-tRNA(G|tara:strand:- start:6536 stop:8011 length:1476 start_codon:yes stop_codon:yes gene_type:complete